MPRPRKCRKVCQIPEVREFKPVGEKSSQSAIILSVDEYEAIRLIDKQGFSQEECGKYMQIARTTVQLIYDSARKKLAEALVNGLSLKIEGGSFRLCDGKEDFCGCGGCKKHRLKQIAAQYKEDGKMKIAVSCSGNQIWEHFGHCENFMIYEAEDGKIVSEQSVANPGHKPGFLPNFLADMGVKVMISGEMGGSAFSIFNQRGVEVILGAHGDAKQAVEAYLRGELKSTGAVCHHHEHSDECGEH